jgi:deoxyribodipyrimidine photolyase-related protein
MVLVLGDQLDRDSAAFDGFDSDRDAVWMAEVREETEHVWCHKLRVAVFFAAMRHFRDKLKQRDMQVIYTQMPRRRSDDRGDSFAAVLRKDIHKHRPEKLIVVEPGDYRVWTMLEDVADAEGIELEIRPDRHFLCSTERFEEWADGRNTLVLETFYRTMRREHDVLMDDDEPAEGRWNFDQDNRESFGRDGPGQIKAPRRFQPDEVTREVIEMVDQRFADHPGSLEDFDLPVTRDEALALLRDFIEHRLPTFGTYEDAMWTDTPFLYHSRLSLPLNLKLLRPGECVEKAVAAYRDGRADIQHVEGFVRQILGWREFVRGVYWQHMPDYADRNALRCGERDVPSFFWDGQTDMRCVSQSMEFVINHGYAHHIHRLMVLGEFALLLGVHPYKFHEWHMAMYLDAIDWVSLPNALGMSQYGDGGILGTKPYCASGNYINKMSPYCKQCRYNHKKAVGEDACPFTTLYWDFLDRHHKQFSDNQRMNFQIKNLERKDDEQLKAIRKQARDLRERIDKRERI